MVRKLKDLHHYEKQLMQVSFKMIENYCLSTKLPPKWLNFILMVCKYDLYLTEMSLKQEHSNESLVEQLGY